MSGRFPPKMTLQPIISPGFAPASPPLMPSVGLREN